jgi:hypothetical protein
MQGNNSGVSAFGCSDNEKGWKNTTMAESGGNLYIVPSGKALFACGGDGTDPAHGRVPMENVQKAGFEVGSTSISSAVALGPDNQTQAAKVVALGRQLLAKAVGGF